jgi:hypothetical protein
VEEAGPQGAALLLAVVAVAFGWASQGAALLLLLLRVAAAPAPLAAAQQALSQLP